MKKHDHDFDVSGKCKRCHGERAALYHKVESRYDPCVDDVTVLKEGEAYIRQYFQQANKEILEANRR